MLDLGTVRPGTTIYIPFHTFDSNDPSASVTITGLALGDIQVYKNGGVTQRASTAGFTLLDTDGIDFDSITGIHGVSINLADNTTAGFYTAGDRYWVVIASVTVDAATVNFIAATFRIGYPQAMLDTTVTVGSQTSVTLAVGPAEVSALVGCPIILHDVASAVQASHSIITAYTATTRVATITAPSFTIATGDNISVFLPSNARWAGATLWGSGAITAASIASNAIADTKIATGALTAAKFASGAFDAVWSVATRVLTAATNLTTALATPTNITAGTVTTVSGNVNGNVTGSVGSVVGHTAQTGDNFALANGASGFVAIKGDTAAILVDTGTTLDDHLTDIKGTGFAKDTHSLTDITTDVTGLNGDAMRGTDNAALASVLGAVADAAAAGDPTATDTAVAYLKQLVNVLVGTTGVTTYPSEAAPANNVSLAEVLSAIHADVTGIAGAAMRGTDSAALASVATEARLAELDAGNLPADVDTLLGRVTSTLFTGITSLAEWLGLIAGKQAGDATALTEIKATGAGSGTYDPTTDSTEAIRDTAPLGTAMRGTDSAATAASLATAQADLDIITGADGVNLLSATQASIDAIETDTSTTLQAELDGIQADTEDLQTQIGTAGAGLTAIPWNGDWDAEVESEVNDALDTAIAELGVAVPTATPTIRTGLMLMYMALRNQLLVQTSGTDAIEVYNNAGTKITQKLITDDGADYTEAKMS